MGRASAVDPDILEAVRRFRDESGIDRVILFGSHVQGDADEGSDVDLVLVDARFEGQRSFERPVGLRRWWPEGLPVDFLCYTPEEFEDLKDRPSLVRTALDEGIAVA